jgi:hypothetical protein
MDESNTLRKVAAPANSDTSTHDYHHYHNNHFPFPHNSNTTTTTPLFASHSEAEINAGGDDTCTYRYGPPPYHYYQHDHVHPHEFHDDNSRWENYAHPAAARRQPPPPPPRGIPPHYTYVYPHSNAMSFGNVSQMEEEDERKQPHDPLFGKNPVGAREDKLLADGVGVVEGVGVGGEEVATTYDARNNDNVVGNEKENGMIMREGMREGVPSIIPGVTTFTSFRAVYVTVHDYRKADKMLLSNIIFKSSDAFGPTEAMELFGEETFVDPFGQNKEYKYPKRGKFQCNYGSNCPFHLHYSFHAADKLYHIKECTLKHNHPATDTTGLDGIQLVKRLSDTTKEERDKIGDLAVSISTMAQIEESMRIAYPKRDFHKTLLKNMVESKRDKVFGTDRHRMGDLMQKGRRCSELGGVWAPEISPDTMRLVGFAYQTARMQSYAKNFGSYWCVADGTHDTNAHKLICIPIVCRCSLGISHLIGVGYHPSENSPDIIADLQLFCISSTLPAPPTSLTEEKEDGHSVGDHVGAGSENVSQLDTLFP